MDKLRIVLKTRDIQLVLFEKASKYSGYDPGGTPPINHKNIDKIIFEKTLLEHKTIFGGGGSRNKMLEMKSEDIIRLADAIIADIVEYG